LYLPQQPLNLLGENANFKVIMKAKYILTIILCTVGGGISALMAGFCGIFRGAVLGLFLAWTFSFLTIKAYETPHNIRQALKNSSFGALAGLLCAVTIIFIEKNIFPKIAGSITELHLVVHASWLLIFICMLYGFTVHFACTWFKKYKFLGVLVAVLLCQTTRYNLQHIEWWQFYTLKYGLLFGFLAGTPFAVLWYLPVDVLLLKNKSSKMTLNNEQNQTQGAENAKS
jgi:hypothetical protein